MKTAFLGASLAAIVGSVASADVTYSFTNQTWAGWYFSEAFASGSLVGSLTGASINVTLNASTNWTYADDLTIYVAHARTNRRANRFPRVLIRLAMNPRSIEAKPAPPSQSLSIFWGSNLRNAQTVADSSHARSLFRKHDSCKFSRSARKCGLC